MSESEYRVRAVHCDYQADDEEVYQALVRATTPLHRSWERLAAARRIAVKLNQEWPPRKLVTYEGQLQELVSLKVARAVFRLLRERTKAEIVCCDVSWHAHYDKTLTPEECCTVRPLLEEFGIPYYEGNRPPYKVVQVPGGGLMFRQYLLSEPLADADAVVSVSKMKNHAYMGVTLCLKNLFGLLPQSPHGRARQYFHHLVRMSYLLPDIGMMLHPALNIIDALVCQAGREWGGQARIGNALIAGDQIIATDAVGAHLMGHDPSADWPTAPFYRDRNPLRVAAEAGLGTANLDEIDYESEVSSPLNRFGVKKTDSAETVAAWRRSTCEQALYYRDHRQEFVDRYAGEYILLQDNEVRWHDTVSDLQASRRRLSGHNPKSALWLKLVDPEEAEGEHWEVYERILQGLTE